MNVEEFLDEATPDPKAKLMARGYLLQQQLIALLPTEQDSMKGFGNANKVMEKAVGFLPIAEYLPDELTDEKAIGAISRIDGMLDLMKALLDSRGSQSPRQIVR